MCSHWSLQHTFLCGTRPHCSSCCCRLGTRSRSSTCSYWSPGSSCLCGTARKRTRCWNTLGTSQERCPWLRPGTHRCCTRAVPCIHTRPLRLSTCRSGRNHRHTFCNQCRCFVSRGNTLRQDRLELWRRRGTCCRALPRRTCALNSLLSAGHSHCRRCWPCTAQHVR